MAALEFYNGAYGLAEAKFILFCTFCYKTFVLDTNTDEIKTNYSDLSAILSYGRKN